MNASARSEELSIIIVNWKSANYLRTCLMSINREIRGISYEVIVVDNGSYDGAAEMVKRTFPSVRYIQSARNLGFSKANNLGYRYASGEVLLFLNPDTELLDPGVQRMLSYLNSNRSVGAVGCRVLNSDLTLQLSAFQAFPTIWNQICAIGALQKTFPKSRLWGARSVIEYDGKPAQLQVLSGSCMMVKRSVFEQVGLFCEDYFMYAEDVDLCYRIHKAGYGIHYVGEGSIIHHGGSSSKHQECHFSSLMQCEAMALFFRKTRGSVYVGMYKASTALIAVVRLVILACLLPADELCDLRRHVRMSVCKWFTLLRWALGLVPRPVSIEADRSRSFPSQHIPI